MAHASELSVNQIERLIWKKKDEMERLCFHRNRELAKERWADYQAEIDYLRRVASGKL